MTIGSGPMPFGGKRGRIKYSKSKKICPHCRNTCDEVIEIRVCPHCSVRMFADARKLGACTHCMFVTQGSVVQGCKHCS